MIPKRSITLRSFRGLLPRRRSATWGLQQSSSSLSDEPQEIQSISSEDKQDGNFHSQHLLAVMVQNENPNVCQPIEYVEPVQSSISRPVKNCGIDPKDNQRGCAPEGPLQDRNQHVSLSNTPAETINNNTCYPNMLPPMFDGIVSSVSRNQFWRIKMAIGNITLIELAAARISQIGHRIKPHSESLTSALYPSLGSRMKTRLITLEREDQSFHVLYNAKPVALHEDLE